MTWKRNVNADSWEAQEAQATVEHEDGKYYPKYRIGESSWKHGLGLDSLTSAKQWVEGKIAQQ